MKKDQELIVITETYYLILWSCNHTSEFPRSHRFFARRADRAEPLQAARNADRCQEHQEPPTIARRSEPEAGDPAIPDAPGERPAIPESKASHREQPYQPTSDPVRIGGINDRRLTQSRRHLIGGMIVDDVAITNKFILIFQRVVWSVGDTSHETKEEACSQVEEMDLV
jgi:hypothetical protein